MICLANLILKSKQKIPRNSKNSHDTQGAKSCHHLSDIISSGPQVIRVMKRRRRGEVVRGFRERQRRKKNIFLNVELMFCFGLPKIFRIWIHPRVPFGGVGWLGWGSHHIQNAMKLQLLPVAPSKLEINKRQLVWSQMGVSQYSVRATPFFSPSQIFYVLWRWYKFQDHSLFTSILLCMHIVYCPVEWS